MADTVFYYLLSWLMKCHLWWCDVHREGWHLRSLTDTRRCSLPKKRVPCFKYWRPTWGTGVLCAACHYYSHVGWCKLIGWIELFLCVLIKGERYRNGSDSFTETSGVRLETDLNCSADQCFNHSSVFLLSFLTKSSKFVLNATKIGP